MTQAAQDRFEQEDLYQQIFHISYMHCIVGPRVLVLMLIHQIIASLCGLHQVYPYTGS